MSVILVSGGIDSTTLLHYIVKELKDKNTRAITINYGQRHSKEIQCAHYQCNLLNIPVDDLDLTGIAKFLNSSSLMQNSNKEVPQIKEVMGDPQPSTYVPNRNMMFLSIAVAYAENVGLNVVYYGAQLHDLYGYFDTSQEFLDRMNYIFELNRKNTIQVKAPFINFKKSQIIKLGLGLGVDYSKTWSCYNGKDKADPTSATSAERLKAFSEVGIPDPIEYMHILDKSRDRQEK